MKVKYFQDTDTLLLNFTDKEIVETRDLNENILVEIDKNGNLVSMTVEHATEQASIGDFSFQHIMRQPQQMQADLQ